MIGDVYENSLAGHRAVLVGVKLKNDIMEEVEESVEELRQLAETASLLILCDSIQALTKPKPTFFIGQGKVEELKNLIEICSKQKEIKLKYELEKNVNLVKFEKNRIEISFNESLDKDFVKDLSSKLFEWTSERWIITFSKLKGQMSVKDKQKNVKKLLIDEMKNSEVFKSVIDRFPDAELIDVNSNKDRVDND